MYLIPYARLSLYSQKSPEAVSLLLIRAIPPDFSGSKRLEQNLCEFFGSVWQNSFVIQRNLNYQNPYYPWFTRFNAFLPIMHGVLKPDQKGTKIVVTAILSSIKLGVALLFYALFLLPMALHLRQAISLGRVDWNGILMGFMLPLFLYLWHTISFNYEVNQVKRFLDKVVLAEPLIRMNDE